MILILGWAVGVVTLALQIDILCLLADQLIWIPFGRRHGVGRVALGLYLISIDLTIKSGCLRSSSVRVHLLLVYHLHLVARVLDLGSFRHQWPLSVLALALLIVFL